VDDVAAELDHALERGREIGGTEVGEREPIPRAWAARVHAELGLAGVRLDAMTLVRAPLAELDVKEAGPKSLRAGGVIGGKLDQREAVYRPSLWKERRQACRNVRWTRLGSVSYAGSAGSCASRCPRASTSRLP
jgi:hypothetical protein